MIKPISNWTYSWNAFRWNPHSSRMVSADEWGQVNKLTASTRGGRMGVAKCLTHLRFLIWTLKPNSCLDNCIQQLKCHSSDLRKKLTTSLPVPALGGRRWRNEDPGVAHPENSDSRVTVEEATHTSSRGVWRSMGWEWRHTIPLTHQRGKLSHSWGVA